MSEKDLFGNTEMRALTWKQPFGTLMLYDKIETRTWNTNYRGKVLICVGKTPYTPDQISEICGSKNHMRIANIFAKYSRKNSEFCGMAIAVADLVLSRPMVPHDEELTFVQYKHGLYCHVYKNVQPIHPIPFKGQQGWKKLDQEFIAMIKKAKD